MIRNILITCIGNICRSPMAEGLLSQFIQDNHLEVKVSSAGLKALNKQPAHPFAQSLMQEQGIDISQHRSRQLTSELVLNADLILVMDDNQRSSIENELPFTKGKIHTLGKWSQFDIPDPIGKSRDQFEIVFKLIAQGIQDWQLKLWKSK